MSITKSTLKASFGGKTDNVDTFTAALWDSVLGATDTSLNAVIDSINGDSFADKFYVNGVEKTPVSGVIALPCFGETDYPEGGYVLSGTLNGQVVLGTATSTLGDGDTVVDLNGVNIITDSEDNAAIMYCPTAQSLRITLCRNKVNKLTCSHVAELTSSQKGCIWSENNLKLQGNGYLSCVNKGGHGIKSSELRVFGNPHIYVEASHDGIHGNAATELYGGVYYINEANDAFGTRAAEGTPGQSGYKSPGYINIFGGKIYAYNILQNVLDSKAEGHIFGEYSIVTDKSTGIMTGMTIVDPKIYFGGADWDTSGTTPIYNPEPSGKVLCYSDEAMTADEQEILYTSGAYTLTTKYCKIDGYIDGKIVAPIQSTDIIVEGKAYLTGNIEYTPTKKKLGVTVEKDAIFIAKGNVISASNLAIEVKAGGVAVIDGIDGGDVTLSDSKGVLLVHGDLLAKMLYIGTAETPDSTKKLWGAVKVDGTTKVVLNSKHAKGNISTLKEGVVGVFCTDKLNVATTSDLKGSNRIYFHDSVGTVIGEKTIEDKDYIA